MSPPGRPEPTRHLVKAELHLRMSAFTMNKAAECVQRWNAATSKDVVQSWNAADRDEGYLQGDIDMLIGGLMQAITSLADHVRTITDAAAPPAEQRRRRNDPDYRTL